MTRYYTTQGLEVQKRIVSDLERQLSSTQKELAEAAGQTGNSWHDNAPFDAVRSDVSILESRIAEAKRELHGAQLIDYPQTPRDQVEIGTRVTFERDGRTTTLDLVGYGEPDIEKFKVLYESPIAQALMSKRVGDEFEADVNGRRSKIKIKVIDIIGADLS